jgi:ribonuclease P protein component
LTARLRSGSFPRHEADLSAQEDQEESHSRFPQAELVSGREKRPQASARQGAQAPHAVSAAEVGVRFGKAARLRRRREFLAVQQRGARVFAGDVIVLALKAGAQGPRIGITVSSKVTNAVGRNRVKRLAREAFRAVATELPQVDLVVIARSGAVNLGLPGLVRALRSAGDRARALGGLA